MGFTQGMIFLEDVLPCDEGGFKEEEKAREWKEEKDGSSRNRIPEVKQETVPSQPQQGLD